MAHLERRRRRAQGLRSALADAEKSFAGLRAAIRRKRCGRRPAPHDAWQSHQPRAEGVGIEFLWYGDCAALLKQGETAVTVVGETFDKRAAEAMRAKRASEGKKSFSGFRHKPARIHRLPARSPQPRQQRQLLAVQSRMRGPPRMSRAG